MESEIALEQPIETWKRRVDRFFGPQKFWLHISLFVLSIFSTAIAGVEWRGSNPLELANLPLGIEYSFLLLLFLSAHEFGHFIAARIHGVDASLPYYIPVPGIILGLSPNFGTFGAVIRTRSRVPSKRAMFDIGVAGPIAGFVICVVVLAIGFITLPGIEYLQAIHPGYPHMKSAGGLELQFGKPLLFSLFENLLTPRGAFLPPMTEVYHYPLLCVGWFGMFVTALNLLPVGQLDGGHLTYALFSHNVHRWIGRLTALALFAIALPETIVGMSSYGWYHAPEWLVSLVVAGGSTWLLWAIIVTFVIRFKHPVTDDESPLDSKRILIGIATMLIFVLCFTPSPIVILN